jgi:hypothetical protein
MPARGAAWPTAAEWAHVGQPQPHAVPRGVTHFRGNPPVFKSADDGREESIELRSCLQSGDDKLATESQEMLTEDCTHAFVALTIATRGKLSSALVPRRVVDWKEISLSCEGVEASFHFGE